MLNITNLTDKSIQITNNVRLSAFDNIDINCDIDARLQQLIRMGLIKIQEINVQTPNAIQFETSDSSLNLKRQELLNDIKTGKIKPRELPLHNIISTSKELNKTIKRKRKS